MAAPTHGPSTTANERSVLLPGRSSHNAKSTTNTPIWRITPTGDGQAPTASLCDKHNRPEQVCCRELRGSDERKLVDPAIVRDVIVGLSDGLTVPFALTAGLASLGSSRIVIVAGLAEIISGSISMGIGGFLASEAERDHFRYLRRATKERVRRSCAGEMEREVAEILSPVGVDDALSRRVASALAKVESDLHATSSSMPSSEVQSSWWRSTLRAVARTPKTTDPEEAASKLKFQEDVGLTAFLLKFGEGMEEVPNSRLFISAFTIATGYAVGGLIPLVPYMVVTDAQVALWWSIAFTAIVLLFFGGFKSYYTGAELGVRGYLKGMLSTLAVGGVAAGASFGIVRILEI